MVAFICVTWLVLFFLTLMAFWRGKILMAAPEDVVMDSMSSKQLEELEEMEKMRWRSETPDEERVLDKVRVTPKPF